MASCKQSYLLGFELNLKNIELVVEMNGIVLVINIFWNLKNCLFVFFQYIFSFFFKKLQKISMNFFNCQKNAIFQKLN